jgi:hypothetical protein
MQPQKQLFPPMPPIGRAEPFYSNLVRQADAQGNVFGHEAAKVGQYINLGLDPNLDWPAKVRYFNHALKRHCVAQNSSIARLLDFYEELTDLVRKHAGLEALRIASAEDDRYARRVNEGVHRAFIKAEAQIFFSKIIPADDKRPDWFFEEDWQHLKLLAKQWI